MNEYVEAFRHRYGKDWPFVMNRLASIADLPKLEAAGFMWGIEAARMLGMDRESQ